MLLFKITLPSLHCNNRNKHSHQNCRDLLYTCTTLLLVVVYVFRFPMILDANNVPVFTVSNIDLTPVVIDYNISPITPYVFVTVRDTAR